LSEGKLLNFGAIHGLQKFQKIDLDLNQLFAVRLTKSDFFPAEKLMPLVNWLFFIKNYKRYIYQIRHLNKMSLIYHQMQKKTLKIIEI